LLCTFCFWALGLAYCRNPSLGSQGKGLQGCEPRGVGESVRMKTHTPKWAPILGVGIPVDSQTFREQLQRLKHLALKSSLYHWKAIEV
jgi:hypothetical protein